MGEGWRHQLSKVYFSLNNLDPFPCMGSGAIFFISEVGGISDVTFPLIIPTFMYFNHFPGQLVSICKIKTLLDLKKKYKYNLYVIYLAFYFS